jgi:thiol-disulfide isomerase/thioredoxin
MKQLSILLVLFFAVISSTVAQNGTTKQSPYQQFPDNPPLNILLVDSTTTFTKEQFKKNKPVFLILFSPDCDHCKHETEDIIRNIDKLKDVHIVMATSQPFEKMKEFYKTYKLDKYKNITVGRDRQYMLITYFDISSLPMIAIYDKKHKLIKRHEGTMTVADMLTYLK